MRGFNIADWAANVPTDVLNAAENPLFKTIELNWSRPTRWSKDDKRPKFDSEEPFLYALIYNHGNSQTKDHIVYIGLTKSPKTRFGNHETARDIVKKRGEVKFSYAPVRLTGRNRVDRVPAALEELEHLLIWAVWQELENLKKLYTLPGMGKNGGNAWHVTNTGYRFSGRMPREIVFPWMLVKSGRDRTNKRS